MTELMRRRRALMAAQKQGEIPYLLNYVNPYSMTASLHTNGYACQGGCVVDDVWYMVTIEQDNSAQYLYSYDLVSKTLTLCGTYSELGHANDLTYNPNTGELLVAPMTNNTIVAIDITDYSISRTITITGMPESTVNVWNIAFDRKRNQILMWLNSSVNPRVYAFDSNGVWLKTIALDTFVEHTTAQGIETDGDYIYCLWTKNPSYIDVFTINGRFVKTQTISAVSYEFEAIGYNWNGLFFMQAFPSSGQQRVYSMLNRTFNGSANLTYTPLSWGSTKETGGTITITGKDSADFVSTASKNYNTIICGAGYPFSYNYLNGKKLKISCDIERLGGSGSGQTVGLSIFTCSDRLVNSGNGRLFQKSYYWEIPASGSAHKERTITIGTDFVPDSGKEGTYIGYWIFLYADSGNSCRVTNFKIEAEIPSN